MKKFLDGFKSKRASVKREGTFVKKRLAGENDSQTKKRNVALKEILDSEMKYLDSLRTIADIFLRPLVDSDLLSDDEHGKIFSNIETLLVLNHRFFGDLQVHMKYSPSKQMIGALFLEFSPFFKMYSHYVQNFETASRLLSLCSKNSRKFEAFITRQEADPRAKGLTLPSLLIMPIQRIPRYAMLVEQLLKHTPQSYEDFSELSRSLDLLQRTAHHINEEVRAQENRNQIRDLELLFAESPRFLVPGRYFVKTGELSKRDRKGKATTFTYFLFNNCISAATKKALSSSLKLVSTLPIDAAFAVKKLTDSDSGGVTTKNLDVSCAMAVSSANDAFVLVAASETERDEWVTLMEESIEWESTLNTIGVKNSHVGQAKGLWQDVGAAKNCQLCRVAFTLTKRKHHCRQCGNVVCDACCTKRMLVSKTLGKGRKTKRICGACDELLHNLEEAESAEGGEQTPGGSSDHKEGIPRKRTIAITREPVVSVHQWTRIEGHHYFEILVIKSQTKEENPDVVRRRHRDFVALDKKIKTKFPLIKSAHGEVEAEEKDEDTERPSVSKLIPFPKLNMIGRNSPESLEERRVVFQLYLRGVFRLFRRYPDLRILVADWLELPVSDLSGSRGKGNSADTDCVVM